MRRVEAALKCVPAPVLDRSTVDSRVSAMHKRNSSVTTTRAPVRTPGRFLGRVKKNALN